MHNKANEVEDTKRRITAFRNILNGTNRYYKSRLSDSKFVGYIESLLDGEERTLAAQIANSV